MAKMTTFAVGLILSSLFITLIAVFMGHVSSSYAVTYDNETLATYNQLNDLANITKQVKDQTEGIQEKSGVLDVIGGFFSDAYQALRVTLRSFGVFETMSNQAVKDLQLGQVGEIIKIALTSIALIILFVGVIISAIAKWDL